MYTYVYICIYIGKCSYRQIDISGGRLCTLVGVPWRQF